MPRPGQPGGGEIWQERRPDPSHSQGSKGADHGGGGGRDRGGGHHGGVTHIFITLHTGLSMAAFFCTYNSPGILSHSVRGYFSCICTYDIGLSHRMITILFTDSDLPFPLLY